MGTQVVTGIDTGNPNHLNLNYVSILQLTNINQPIKVEISRKY